MIQYRQGDLLIVKLTKEERAERLKWFDVDKAKRISDKVLALGEVTGHRHEVLGDSDLFEFREGQMYLKVNSTATIAHLDTMDKPTGDHDPVQLDEGEYIVQRQREFDGRQNFWVGD